MFSIGQQVVCIKEGNWISADTGKIIKGTYPIKGCIYTISGFHDSCIDKNLYLILTEINEFFGVWNSVHFKPIHNTDISVFTKLLKTKPKELVNV